jgi:hypothetical protein
MKKEALIFRWIAIIATLLYTLNFIQCNAVLSPSKMGGADAAVFSTIGFSWLHGIIPYRDLFDHKGPVLYAINLLGWFIADDSSGIVMLEMASAFLWVSITLFLCRKNLYLGIIFLWLLKVLLVGKTFEGGNLTEEYAVLFGIISVYFSLNCRNKIITYLFYGVCASFCFYIRPNLASPILALFIIDIVKTKNTRALLLAFLWTGIGFAAIAAPINLYFYYNDALYKMYDSMLFFNVKYLSARFSTESFLMYFIESYVLFMLTIAVMLILIRRIDKTIFYASLFVVAMTWFFANLSSRSYGHYFMIFIVPYVYIISRICAYDANKIKMHIVCLVKDVFKVQFCRFFAVCLTFAFLIAYGYTTLNNNWNAFSDKLRKQYAVELNSMKIVQGSKILNLGSHAASSIFYLTKTLPRERIFFPETTKDINLPDNPYLRLHEVLGKRFYDFVVAPPSFDFDFSRFGYEKIGVFKGNDVYGYANSGEANAH